MINLWYSNGFWTQSDGRYTGPQIVVKNLIEALKQENIPYSVNENKYDRNFIIQYDHTGHELHKTLDPKTCIIGPQIWPFDSYGKYLMENPNTFHKIIVPSDWVTNLFTDKFNLDKTKVSVWSVGIPPRQSNLEKIYDCLIYFKRRPKEQIDSLVKLLREHGLTYKVVSYGSYEQSTFEQWIAQSKFCFLLNGTESQGIAVQEILAYNIPMLVWDIDSWVDMGEEYKIPATSIPYWDFRCGEKFYTYDDIVKNFDYFYANLANYKPKEYVEENLSYSKSILNLLSIFQ